MSVPHSLDLRLIFHSFQFCHVWVGCHIFLFLIQENIYKYTYSIHVCKRHTVPYFPYATSWFHPRNSSQSTSKYVKADTHAQRINYAKSLQIMEVCQRQILTGYVITIQKCGLRLKYEASSCFDLWRYWKKEFVSDWFGTIGVSLLCVIIW